jgi:hypothetical protein
MILQVVSDGWIALWKLIMVLYHFGNSSGNHNKKT